MAVTRTMGAKNDAKESASDLRGKELHLATRTADGKFDLCGNGEVVAGVITEGRDVGYHTSVDTGNQTKALAGGAITAGNKVQSNADGEVVEGNTNSFGTAINSVASGEIVEIDVDRT